MTLVIVILSGFLGAGIGFGLGLVIAIAMAGPLGIAPMEGAQGYFAVAVGLVAGLIGMILAMILALRWRGVTQAGPVMMGVGKAFGGVLVVAALSFGLYWLFQPQLLGRNGAAPQMYFEISPPAGVTTDPSAITMTMDLNAPGRPEVYWSKDLAKTDDGQSALTGHVELYHRASWRCWRCVLLTSGQFFFACDFLQTQQRRRSIESGQNGMLPIKWTCLASPSRSL